MVAKADEAVAEALRNKGYTVMTKGWPDLLVLRTNREDPHPARYGTKWSTSASAFAIELKRNSDRLRPEQERMAGVFRDVLGVPYYVGRDADIERLLRKQGARIALPGHDDIRAKRDELRMLRQTVNQRLDELEATIEATSFVFEAVAPPEMSADELSRRSTYGAPA